MVPSANGLADAVRPTLANIPPELRAIPQWVLWRSEAGRKVPYDTKHYRASTGNPKTWTDFETVVAHSEGYAGLGFVFAKGGGYVGIDLDDCRDAAGVIADWAQEIIDQLDTYAEISPSGTGVKLWARGSLPVETSGGKAGSIEMYHHSRYFCVTGHVLGHGEIRECQSVLDELWQRIGKGHEVNGHEANGSIIVAGSAVDACIRELLTLPEAIEGYRGSDATYLAACTTFRWGLDGRDAMRALRVYNERRCFPEWSDAELKHKLRSARPNIIESGEFCSRLPQYTFGAVPIPSANGVATAKSRFEVFSVHELFQTPPIPDWFITDVIGAEQPCLWVGGSKTLKTTLMMHMACCLTSQAHFLGNSIPKRRRVLVFSGESGRFPLLNMVRRSCQFLGVDWETLEGSLLLCTSMPRCSDVRDVREWAAVIRDFQPDVVAIDPVYLCLSGDDSGNLSKQGSLLRRLHEVCMAEKALFMIAHHAKKTSGGRKTLNDAAGAGFEEFAGQWLVISRRRPYIGGSQFHELAIDIGGRFDQSILYELDVRLRKADDLADEEWTLDHRIVAGNAEEREQPRDYTPQKERILGMLRLLGRETKTAVRYACTGMGNEVFIAAWDSLIADEAIIRSGEITKGIGRGYPAYEASPPEQSRTGKQA